MRLDQQSPKVSKHWLLRSKSSDRSTHNMITHIELSECFLCMFKCSQLSVLLLNFLLLEVKKTFKNIMWLWSLRILSRILFLND